MKSWVIYAALTVLSWGVWGVFSKLASAHSKPRQVLIYQSVGVLAFGVLVLALEKFKVEWSPVTFSWAAAGGFLVFIGFLTFFAALKTGQASTVVVLSALYPVVTIILSLLFLHERITIRQGVGIVLALVASVLLSME